MRRSGAKRRGLQNTQPRRKITCGRGAPVSFLSLRTRQWISSAAEKSFQYSFRLSSALCIIPLIKSHGSEGKYVRAPAWRMSIMCLFIVTIVMSMCQKLCVFYERITHENTVDIITMLSFMLFWFQLMALSTSIACSLRPNVTANLRNSWDEVLESLEEVSPGKLIMPWSNTNCAVQLLLNFVGPLFGSFVIPLFLSLYIPHTPVFGLSILEGAGVVRLNSEVPRWLWSLLFYPMEVYQFVLPYLAFLTATQSMVMEYGTLRVFLTQLRKISTTDVGGRLKLQRLYGLLQVHVALAQEWLKPALVPFYFSVGGSVVFLFYFPIGYSELPAILGLGFHPTALVLMGTVMWVSVDLVMTIRISEEIVGKLQAVSELPRGPDDDDDDEWKLLMRTAKSLRPIRLPLGEFGNFSMDVPVVLWEEVLNQLLFLLSF